MKFEYCNFFGIFNKLQSIGKAASDENKKSEKSGIEDEFCCIITKERFQDPVIAEDGFTYEKTAILKWLKTNNTSPVTRELIGHKLTENQWMRQKLGLPLAVLKTQNRTKSQNWFHLPSLSLPMTEIERAVSDVVNCLQKSYEYSCPCMETHK